MKFYEMILFWFLFAGTLLTLDKLVLFGAPVALLVKSWFGGLLIVLVCAMYFGVGKDDSEDEGNGSLR